MDVMDIILLIIITGFAISDNWVRNKSHEKDKSHWFDMNLMVRDSLIAYCSFVNEEQKMLLDRIDDQELRIEQLEERLGRRIKIT